MLKCRLRATLSSLLPGECNHVSVTKKFLLLNRCAGISSYSRGSTSYIRRLAFVKLKGVESKNRSLHTLSEDDYFLELGAPVRKEIRSPKQLVHTSDEGDGFSELGAVKKDVLAIPKLMTEKSEPFLKTNGKRKVSSSSSWIQNFLRMEDSIPEPHDSPAAVNDKSASDSRDLTTVTIQNVSPMISLSQLKLAMSTSEKISNAAIRRVADGSMCCDIEFENVESSKRATAVGSIKVKNFNFPVCPLHIKDTVSIRINNLNSETADSAIHRRCMSYASLQGLARVKENAADALFRVKDKSDAEDLLEKLNNTIMDGSRWSAHLQSTGDMLVVTTDGDDAEDQLELEIRDCIADMKRRIALYKVYAKDLENLHHSILHLEGQPAAESN